ncbi:MAG TPA: hypothetical protein VGM51_05240 [Armatimonadota bacterium]|jgi:hypothetical protein
MSVPRNRTKERGQIIVIAVGVMFLLALIAGIFLTLISRNIGRTARGGDVLQAQYLAEAGIRYADQQLTHSILGADWRPDPEPAVAGDPDEDYLKAGYSRFNQGNGRFLLRVSYQPVKLDKAGKPVMADGVTGTTDRSQMVYPDMDKFIKIECVGRRGVVDANDPTTWRNADPLKRALVAYKPIGITDYARYETNKDRSDNTMVLGSDPFALPAGNADKNFTTRIYGPIRVNGDLMWSGLNDLVLNAAEAMGPGSTYLPVLGTVGVNRDDTVAVAGAIFHDALPADVSGDQVTLTDKGPNALNALGLLPSDSPAFTTGGGRYRDGSAGISKSEGRLRGVSRLEPPLMDDVETSTGVMRFRLLTRNTGVVPPGKSWNTGQNGLGMGIYVDNGGEIQKDNQYQRLMDEWSRTGTGRESESRPGSAWRQYLYTPPGAEVYLDPTPSRDLNSAFPVNQSQGTIIITRHDGKAWKDENGDPEGFTRRYRYPLRQVFDNTGALVDTDTYDNVAGDQFRDATGAYKTFQNGVLYFEGNLRLQGKLPADWVAPSSGRVVGQHLTFVTLGTAYIEGNLLKGDAASVANVNGYGPGLQVGSITVIAKDYVCVNSTAYFMRQPDSGPWNFALGNPYSELSAPDERFVTGGYSAVNPTTYGKDALGAGQELMLLQTAEGYPGGAAELDMYAYGDNASASRSLIAPGVPMTVAPGQYPEAPAENIWQHRVIPLTQAPNNRKTSWEITGHAMPDQYAFTYRPYFGPPPVGASTGTEFTQNYNQPLWLSRVTISPLDIRIEAVIYAQEGSFFVIPGEWMNGNPADVRADAIASSRRFTSPIDAGWRLADNPDKSPYPFYGEPADIRVVICGAIAENQPADKDFQTAWSRHWGWTPTVRPDGSNGVHGGEGLVYMYDNNLRVPVRFDRFNRPLPPTPALPVSPDLVFSGEAS